MKSRYIHLIDIDSISYMEGIYKIYNNISTLIITYMYPQLTNNSRVIKNDFIIMPPFPSFYSEFGIQKKPKI